MTMRHDDPYVVERDRTTVTNDTSSPALLIVGILLAIGLAIGAWFAFTNGDNGGDVTNIDNSEQVVPGGETGDTTDTSGTTDDGTTTDTGDTTTP